MKHYRLDELYKMTSHIYYEQNYISGHILAVYEWGPFNIVYGIGIPVFYVSSMR